jgi:hypothetical protein
MTDTASASLPALGSCLEDYPYPYPVRFLRLTNDLRPVAMAYMDIPPTAEPNGQTVVLFHGKAFGCYYFQNVIEAEPVSDGSSLLARPTVNLRHFPNLSAGEQDKPAVHELVMAIYDDQTVTNAWAGTGELDFPEAPGEELHALAPVRTGTGLWFTLSYSVTDLRTL